MDNISFKDKYTKVKKIGEGTYGIVYKAVHNKTSAVVALKKIKFIEDDQGVPVSALREICILQMLNHPNIIKLYEVSYDCEKAKLYLVLQFIPQNLNDILHQNFPLSPFLIKSYIFQLLKAVYYLQSKRIMHRDLKLHNILVTEEGKIKLCDFGLSKNYNFPLKDLTLQVQTLWYRAPEILLGKHNYDPSIDIWAIGCILAELCEGKPFFQGICEIDQIFKILQQLGTPTLNQFPDLASMQHFKCTFPRFKGKKIYIKNLQAKGIDLIKNMLQLDPSKRINIKQALNHPYFEQCSDLSQV